MKDVASLSIISYFEDLSDPRILKKTDHKLIDIVVIAICAVVCGADKWTQVEAFGNARRERLKGFLELANGIPSHDTFIPLGGYLLLYRQIGFKLVFNPGYKKC